MTEKVTKDTPNTPIGRPYLWSCSCVDYFESIHIQSVRPVNYDSGEPITRPFQKCEVLFSQIGDRTHGRLSLVYVP